MCTRILFSFVMLALTASCGPGRQAAWEKPHAASRGSTAGESAAGDPETENALASAETYWQDRLDRSKLEKAIAIWERLAAARPNDVALLTRLSRAYYLLADGHIRPTEDEDLMLATFEKGVLAGENAMMASSAAFRTRVEAEEKVEAAVEEIPKEGIAAIYWYATNLGKFAVAKGFTTILFYKDRLFQVMQHVLKLDEKFFHGAPHRYFGAYYAKAPSFAGGDMDKSREHFDRALAIAPDYLGTKVLYAEFYATKADDQALFERLLDEVKKGNADVLAELTPEQLLEKRKADVLLGQVDELF